MDNFDLVLTALAAAEQAAQQSRHETNPIGAALVHPENPSLLVSGFNHVPDVLRAKGLVNGVGSSSSTIHAELTATFAFKGDPRGAYLALTDPFCPNCGKYLAELGVRMVVIATDGLRRDFAQRRGEAFHRMSLLMARRAGMAVGLIDRRDRAVDWLVPPGLGIYPVSGGHALFDAMPLDMAMQQVPSTAPWAMARVRLLDGTVKNLIVYESLPPGMTPQDFAALTDPELLGKYRFAIDPLTRLLLVCKRQRMVLLDDAVGCHLVPSSRALVNAVGYGIQKIICNTKAADHDPQGAAALETLMHAGVLDAAYLLG